MPSSAGFIRLVRLRSLLLDFLCATPATPIAQDRLFLNVRSVGHMARPQYSAPVPSSAGFIRLIFLQSLLLDFPCATLATPIALDRLFLMFSVDFCSWLKNRSLNEEMKMFRVVKGVSRPFGIPMDGPKQKGLCDTFLCIMATPQFCITQCLECFPPKKCIPERFQEIMRAYYSIRIPLPGPAAAARPLYNILVMLEPLWPQIANKTENWRHWPVKFSALLDKLQQH